MVRNVQDKCIAAGIQLGRDAQGVIVYPDNVRGLVRTRDLMVPHSELAIHVGAAGNNLLAWSCYENYCDIVFETKDGSCEHVRGLDLELLSTDLRRVMERMWG